MILFRYEEKNCFEQEIEMNQVSENENENT